MERGFFHQQHQNQNQNTTQQTQPQQFINTNSNIHNQYNDVSNNSNIGEMKNNQETLFNSSSIQPKEFKFELPFLIEHKDQNDFHSNVTIRGVLNDDQKYDVWRKIIRMDKNEKKMSPSWLSRNRDEIAKGILMKAFKVDAQAIPKTKKESLTLCFEKLKWLNAQKKLNVKALMRFDEDEIKIIHNKMLFKIEIMDLTRELFDYFASQAMHLQNEYFMDILDDSIRHKLYEDAVYDIYNGLHQIMMKTRTPNKFDLQFIFFQKRRLKCQEFKKLLTIFDELVQNVFRTYQVNRKLLSNIYIYSILNIYLKTLTCVVYELLENNLASTNIDNNATTEQSASFGGSGFCSMQRIAYSRNLSTTLRKKRIFLQKHMLCQENEKHLVPMELQYQNAGGLYFLTPSLYPLGIRVLSSLAVVLNRHLILPSESLPEFRTLINNQINNKQNIEEFKKIFPLQILTRYNEDISIIYERWMTFMCRKYIYAKLKQADFGEVGLGLRDQFNFGHMEYIRKRKKSSK